VRRKENFFSINRKRLETMGR